MKIGLLAKKNSNIELNNSEIDHLYIGFNHFKKTHKLINANVGFKKLFPTFLFDEKNGYIPI